MNTAQIVATVAQKTGFSKKQVQATIRAFVEALRDALAKEGSVKIHGLGRFVVKTRKPRKVRLFGSGKVITTQPKKAVSFRAAKALKDAVV